MNRIGVGLAMLLVIAPAGAQSSWVSAGLENRVVNCLLADESRRLLAGTDQGLFISDGDSWLPISGATSLPVNGTTEVGAGTVVVSAGNGSRSDGLYIGHAIYGPPYYEFTLLAWFMNPGPISSRIRNALPGTGIQLFAGQGGAVFTGVIVQTVSGGTVLKEGITLTRMKQPSYCFGVEQPVCAAVHVFSADGACYAGGYDGFRGNPGPGSLVWEVAADSLATKRASMDVTAIAEGMLTVSSAQYQGLARVLTVGTIDGGVYAYAALSGAQPQPASYWAPLGSPSQSPVAALLAAPGSTPGGDDLLYAATARGVYRKCAPNMNCLWQPVGAIPLAPTSLAVAGKNSLLYAGTGKGVYVYGAATAAMASRQDQGPRRLAQAGPGQGVRLHDVSGRALCPGQSRHANLKAGVYFHATAGRGEIIASGVVPLR